MARQHGWSAKTSSACYWDGSWCDFSAVARLGGRNPATPSCARFSLREATIDQMGKGSCRSPSGNVQRVARCGWGPTRGAESREALLRSTCNRRAARIDSSPGSPHPIPSARFPVSGPASAIVRRGLLRLREYSVLRLLLLPRGVGLAPRIAASPHKPPATTMRAGIGTTGRSGWGPIAARTSRTDSPLRVQAHGQAFRVS